MLDSLISELSGIDLLIDIDGTVTTHVYTEPAIVVTARTATEPDRDQLVTIGIAVQAAVDGHQREGTRTRVTLRTTVRAADLNWHWGPTTKDTPGVDQQVDACLTEIDLGARTVSLDDGLSSRWSTIDDSTVLQTPPVGMRRVTRWVSFATSQDLTVTVHASQPSLDWPVTALVTGIRSFLHSLNLVVMDDWAHWQLSLDVDEETSAAFSEAVVHMLRLLRTVDAPDRHTLDCTGPWWVNFAIGVTVAIDQWLPDKARSVDRAVIQQVVDRANQ